MKMARIILAAVLLLCALLMLAFGGFSVWGMANMPRYFRYDDFDSFHAARESHHWKISLVSWITFFLMGIVLTAALILLRRWWRKGLAAWGMFTCLVMFVAAFFLSSKIPFNEIGYLWIAASLWMTLLFLALGISGFLDKDKTPASPTAPEIKPGMNIVSP